MGDRQEGDEAVRKLQVTGEAGGSYMITLPKGLVEELGGREHQKVTVHRRGQELIITDWSE